jgi:hypothetical protein
MGGRAPGLIRQDGIQVFNGIARLGDPGTLVGGRAAGAPDLLAAMSVRLGGLAKGLHPRRTCKAPQVCFKAASRSSGAEVRREREPPMRRDH